MVTLVTSASGASVPSVSIGSAMAGKIPSDFLGLSFDFSVLPRIGRYSSSGNLVALLRSLAPTGILRFGGGSLDADTAWSSDGAKPAWASSMVTPADLTRLHSLAVQTGWRIVLGLGLGHYDPTVAAQEAVAAQSALGPYLAAFEIGNEPDLFVSQGLRNDGWRLSDYLKEVDAYRDAISMAAPGVPIEGPDVTASLDGLTWLAPYAHAEHASMITAHYYPFTSGGCGTAPTTADLVSEATVSKEANRLALLSGVARTTSVPVRLSEANDASCGGQPGVSNTFASAIWLTQLLTLSAQAGLSGLNLNDQPSSCTGYSALCTATAADSNQGNLTANPKWFALRVFAQLIGTQPLAVSTDALPNGVSVSAFEAPDGTLKLVLINSGAANPGRSLMAVQLPWQAAEASAMTLGGASLASTSTPSLGDSIAPAVGSWSASRVVLNNVSNSNLSLDLPAQSIQVVTVQPKASDPAPNPSGGEPSTSTSDARGPLVPSQGTSRRKRRAKTQSRGGIQRRRLHAARPRARSGSTKRRASTARRGRPAREGGQSIAKSSDSSREAEHEPSPRRNATENQR